MSGSEFDATRRRDGPANAGADREDFRRRSADGLARDRNGSSEHGKDESALHHPGSREPLVKTPACTAAAVPRRSITAPRPTIGFAHRDDGVDFGLPVSDNAALNPDTCKLFR
jgi:hypothetical protein